MATTTTGGLEGWTSMKKFFEDERNIESTTTTNDNIAPYGFDRDWICQIEFFTIKMNGALDLL